jgi:hypothetical protein
MDADDSSLYMSATTGTEITATLNKDPAVSFKMGGKEYVSPK